MQAWGLSSMGGLMFTPKPGAQVARSTEEMLDSRRQWTQNCMCLQMLISNENEFLNFGVEKEHPQIVAEAFSLVEALVVSSPSSAG